MAKTILPQKLIIDIKDDGSVLDTLLVYKISNDGAINGQFSSVAVSVDGTSLQAILDGAINSAKTSEGI